MMTVKHVAKSGEEFVWPATHTSYEPGGGNNTSAEELFFRWDENGIPHQILEGFVFVMNEHGRTVARYQLPRVAADPHMVMWQAGK
jgi:hypothetical protein